MSKRTAHITAGLSLIEDSAENFVGILNKKGEPIYIKITKSEARHLMRETGDSFRYELNHDNKGYFYLENNLV